MKRAAIIVLTESALATARKVAEATLDGEIHGLADRVPDCDVVFSDTAAHLQMLFRQGRPIVGVCSAGILVRTLAPALADKRAEPPILAIAEDSSSVVPLLGGHHGANALARRIAEALGGMAAVTTAGDLRFGVALDEPPDGWILANGQDVKPFMAALLAGGRISLEGDAPWLVESDLPFDADGALTIRVSDSRVAGGPTSLVYHRRNLAVGVGCERDAAPDEAVELVRRTLAEFDLPAGAVAGVYSIDLKMDEPAVEAVADDLGAPLRFFAGAELERETPRLANPSELVYAQVGCHGVAEAAALAAAGPDAPLVVPKRKSRRVTCALARSGAIFDGYSQGAARGRLSVVGIGPGEEGLRTPEASRLIEEAEDVVGYGLYLDLLGQAAAGKRLHRYDLEEEEERVHAALDLAATGRRVALISSGDAGIYALATLVFESLDNPARSEWQRVEIAVAPGISAMQAAAARSGAPLGHDFCAISLSDLLTPWNVIERRIRAAAEGDFVIALYNPVSRRRARQLAAARDILLTQRPADTPVVLARNLGREGEVVSVVDLGDLRADGVDMLTLVLVGSSETRRVERGGGGAWVYTPRGYAGKQTKAVSS
ncbi:MAG: precorrin-3B C(17)-methyltransferase [Rhodospirillales bacterium]|nr:precorrin-3B C(17)-methyltransferase [Rhodospirillales bacterium]